RRPANTSSDGRTLLRALDRWRDPNASRRGRPLAAVGGDLPFDPREGSVQRGVHGVARRLGPERPARRLARHLHPGAAADPRRRFVDDLDLDAKDAGAGPATELRGAMLDRPAVLVGEVQATAVQGELHRRTPFGVPAFDRNPSSATP